jgi:release factor glutamine methyltransferase
MQPANIRVLSPYEKNQLRIYGVSEEIALKSETPVEYLTHHVEFCGLNFYVDENVLIPRIETEELVDMTVETAKDIFAKTKKEVVIADVGTGCGAIAICLATKLENLKIPFEITATEISSRALEIAKKNAKKLIPDTQIEFVESNLMGGISEKFDLITANLPYIPTERIEFLDDSVKDFEPRIALDGGNNGLQLIYKFIDECHDHVYPHSKILLEVDYTHSYDDFNQFRNDWDIVITPDTAEGVHFVILQPK